MVLLIKTLFFSITFYILIKSFTSSRNKFLQRLHEKDNKYRYKKAFEGFGRKFTRFFNREEIEKKLKKAGRPFGMTPEIFIATKFIIPILGLSVQASWDTPLYWKIGISALMFFMPEIFLNMAEKDRKKEIMSEIPEVTDIFEAAAAAGIDTGEVYRLAADFTEGKELKKELTLLAAEYTITKDKQKALEQFRENIGLYDTDILSLALLQGDITGRAQGMLESLSSAQHDNVVAKLHREDKLIDYKVLMTCGLIAVGIAGLFIYPYFSGLSQGLEGIFK